MHEHTMVVSYLTATSGMRIRYREIQKDME